MKIAFHQSDKERERMLAANFCLGARRAGHETEARPLGPDQPIGDCDLAVMVGVKSRDLWRASRAAGVRTLMIDKGYSRHRKDGRIWEYWRISLDAHHPTNTTLLKRSMHWNRFESLGIDVLPYRGKSKGSILIAGSSAKYHSFYDLPEPTSYATKLIKRLGKKSDREIVYRPKPSWRDARPLEGARYSVGKEHLSNLFETTYCLITHGSNACFDAMVYGVPCIILGDGVARSISSTDIEDIDRLMITTDIARRQLLANLAFHQWTESEMASGEMFKTLGEWIDAE